MCVCVCVCVWWCCCWGLGGARRPLGASWGHARKGKELGPAAPVMRTFLPAMSPMDAARKPLGDVYCVRAGAGGRVGGRGRTGGGRRRGSGPRGPKSHERSTGSGKDTHAPHGTQKRRRQQTHQTLRCNTLWPSSLLSKVTMARMARMAAAGQKAAAKLLRRKIGRKNIYRIS